MQRRVTRMRQDLIDPAADHDVTRQQQGHARIRILLANTSHA
jgi:hypothetical protein